MTLIHFKRFNDLDWHSILGTSEQVELIIAPNILKELNKKKDSDQNKGMRLKSREILKELEKYHDNREVKEGVFLNFIPIEPLIDWKQNGLDSDISDDRLIASMITEEDISKLVLVTSDYGLKLKAGLKQIKIITLDDSLMEEVRIDADAKRIQELEKEVARFKNASPKLKLFVKSSSNSKFYEFEFKKVDDIDPVTIETQIEQLRDELQYKKSQDKFSVIGMIESARGITEDEINRYQTDVEKYLDKMRNYYEEINKFDKFKSRLFPLDIILANIGEKPALDIDVFLYFPDGFEILDEDDISEYAEPELPDKPIPPRTVYEKLVRQATAGMYPFNYKSMMPSLDNISPMNLGLDYSLVSIEKTNSYKVQFKVEKLKQNLDITLAPIWLLFCSYDEVKSFSFNYVINVENYPDEFKGEYHIKFKHVE